jgi:hypothetical protein
MLRVCLTLSFASALLVGCTDGRGDTFCLTAHPRYYTAEEMKVVPIETLRKDVATNEYGEKHCGWTPVHP